MRSYGTNRYGKNHRLRKVIWIIISVEEDQEMIPKEEKVQTTAVPSIEIKPKQGRNRKLF